MRFIVHYCLESKNKYVTYEGAKETSLIDEAVDLIDELSNDNDVVYVELLESMDRLILTGDQECDVFLEIESVNGGIFSKDMSYAEAKKFLDNITVDFSELDAIGFKSNSV